MLWAFLLVATAAAPDDVLSDLLPKLKAVRTVAEVKGERCVALTMRDGSRVACQYSPSESDLSGALPPDIGPCVVIPPRAPTRCGKARETKDERVDVLREVMARGLLFHDVQFSGGLGLQGSPWTDETGEPWPRVAPYEHWFQPELVVWFEDRTVRIPHEGCKVLGRGDAIVHRPALLLSCLETTVDAGGNPTGTEGLLRTVDLERGVLVDDTLMLSVDWRGSGRDAVVSFPDGPTPQLISFSPRIVGDHLELVLTRRPSDNMRELAANAGQWCFTETGWTKCAAKPGPTAK